MDCIFCKIIAGEIPCSKVFENDKVLAFLDIQPLSKGHTLVIPKVHGVKLHDIPDEYLVDVLPVMKKLAIALGVDNYNLLQNNGPRAHQAVDHAHFHIIPKIDSQGLGIRWEPMKQDSKELSSLAEEIRKKIF
ncbi:MAG: HIT family protein [Candidatus Hodarchaeales archaeon]|jgi:diadenosine tetraphosphate (Ap4A) HIT family hydrolase